MALATAPAASYNSSITICAAAGNLYPSILDTCWRGDSPRPHKCNHTRKQTYLAEMAWVSAVSGRGTSRLKLPKRRSHLSLVALLSVLSEGVATEGCARSPLMLNTRSLGLMRICKQQAGSGYTQESRCELQSLGKGCGEQSITQNLQGSG